MSDVAADASQLVADIRQMIDDARQRAATAVNAELALLYWQIGMRINRQVLKEKRADYGKEIVSTLSRQLVAFYGRGFSAKNLHHMMRFAHLWEDGEIVSTLSRQLSWSHLKELLYLDDPLKRDFYTELTQLEQWSVRQMRERIQSMLYERTALSKKPEALIEHELAKLRVSGKVKPELLLKDPYVLDFLDLNDHYLERDLEDAILRELEQFLLELGGGFAFIARQKRLQIDDDDFYIDLLFYNRKLQRLVAIDLMLGDFKAEYKGQMELYLRWLARHEWQPEEASPLGIILCAGKKQEQIELLELDQSGIHVAEYLTDLPPRAMLEAKLQQSINNARQRLLNEKE